MTLKEIFFILCCFVFLQSISTTRNDGREILEKIIDALVDYEKQEEITVSRNFLRTDEIKDSRTPLENNLDDGENIIRAIENVQQSDRKGNGERRLFDDNKKLENYGRQWITADAGYRGTNTTTRRTTIFTTTSTIPPSTTASPGRTSAPQGRPKTCVWIWFRKFCF